jgi:LysM repeat protein
MRNRSLRFLTLVIVALLTGSMVAGAQDASNLLINGGLEEGSFGPYTGRRGGEFPIYLPNGWNYWFAPANGDRYNREERVSIQPHPGPGPSTHGGDRALNISCGYFTCTTALYQQVGNIQAGSNVQASAWSQVKACNLAPNATSCGSAVESGSQTRIGIDPTGGTDPNNPAIVWSGWVQPHDQWAQQSVSATATAGTVTLFLYSTQSSFADLNKTYWDDVILAGGGTGGSAPNAPTAVPTAPPYVNFVVPQAPQEDGSIVHTVQQGDTIDSIAFAYGITRVQLMQMNNLQSANFIFPGQKLIVKEATSSGGATSKSTAESTAEADVPLTTQEAAASESTEESVEIAQAATTVPATAVPAATQPEETQATAVPATPRPTQPLSTAPVVVANAAAIDPASTMGQVCVTLFDDANQNRIQEEGEKILAGGTIALTQGNAQAGDFQTDGETDPYCFDELAAGDYVAAASAPEGYGLTTPDQLRVRLNAGATLNLAFGAAQGVQAVQPPPADAGAPVTNPLTPETQPQQSLAERLLSISGLLVFGLAAVVLVGGVGVALLLRRR